jgi:hypothetical protein
LLALTNIEKREHSISLLLKATEGCYIFTHSLSVQVSLLDIVVATSENAWRNNQSKDRALNVMKIPIR